MLNIYRVISHLIISISASITIVSMASWQTIKKSMKTLEMCCTGSRHLLSKYSDLGNSHRRNFPWHHPSGVVCVLHNYQKCFKDIKSIFDANVNHVPQ